MSTWLELYNVDRVMALPMLRFLPLSAIVLLIVLACSSRIEEIPTPEKQSAIAVGEDSQPASTPTPASRKLKPTVGMLQAFPVGQFVLSCWKKEGEVWKTDVAVNLRSFVTVACEGAGGRIHTMVYIDVWVWPESSGSAKDVEVSFAILTPGSFDLLQTQNNYLRCTGVIMTLSTFEEAKRDAPLEGDCVIFSNPDPNGSRGMGDLMSDWVKHSGLEEATTREGIEPVLEVLKR